MRPQHLELATGLENQFAALRSQRPGLGSVFYRMTPVSLMIARGRRVAAHLSARRQSEPKGSVFDKKIRRSICRELCNSAGVSRWLVWWPPVAIAMTTLSSSNRNQSRSSRFLPGNTSNKTCGLAKAPVRFAAWLHGGIPC